MERGRWECMTGWLTWDSEYRTVSQIVGAVRDRDVKWEEGEKENGSASGKGGGAGERENEKMLRERRRV